jgi:hypothetical protein
MKYPNSIVLSKATIYNTVTNLSYMGPVLDKQKFRKRLLLTEDKLDNKSASLEASLKKSLCHLAPQCRLPKSTARGEDNGDMFFHESINS